MRKHFQVVLPECRALLFVRPGQNLCLTLWRLPLERVGRHEGSPRPQVKSRPGANRPQPWSTRDPEHETRKARLRLLAPALRRALSAASQHALRSHAQVRRARLLQAPISTSTQDRTLTTLLVVCLAPADAAALRIYWVVV